MLTDSTVPVMPLIVTRSPSWYWRQMFRRIVKRFNELAIQITVPQRILVRDGPDGDSL